MANPALLRGPFWKGFFYRPVAFEVEDSVNATLAGVQKSRHGGYTELSPRCFSGKIVCAQLPVGFAGPYIM